MLWSDIRKTYPEQWLIVEALEAHSTSASHRVLERLAVVETVPNGRAAFDRYRSLHSQYPQRELYFVHTSREELVIQEYPWSGIRIKHAAFSLTV